MPAPTRRPSDLTRRAPLPERRPALTLIDLPALGWDDFFAQPFAPYIDTHRPGRVVRVDRGAANVMTACGEVRAALRPDLDVTVGDWGTLPLRDTGPMTVDAVLPR